MRPPVAVVVGVGPGLGAALARRFAKGYAVALAARERDKLEALASELGAAGERALAVPCDVSRGEEIAVAADRMPFIHRLRPDLQPEDMLRPSAIAETYWHLAHQDPSAWTQEVDLRPFKERF